MSRRLSGFAKLSVLVLASESPDKGTGHVQRQIALATELRNRSYDVAFLGSYSEQTSERIRRLGLEVHRLPDGSDTIETLENVSSKFKARYLESVIVVDDYHLLSRLKDLQSLSQHLVVFADGQDIIESPAILIDSARRNSIASLGTSTIQLIGAEVAIIGSSAKMVRKYRAKNSILGKRILINFGGSDPTDASYGFACLSSDLRQDFDFHIVLGGLYSGQSEQIAEGLKGVSVSRDNDNCYFSALRSCRAAIGGAGLSAYERAFAGVPSLVLPIAENQIGIAQILKDSGAVSLASGPLSAKDINSFLARTSEPEEYARMAEAGRNLVDGNGVARIVDAMESLREVGS